MTTPQSGREAFEALVDKWRDAARGIRPSGTWNGNDLADRYEWCADELEAALAQQEHEVDEAVAWIHKDGRALLLDESMHRATNPADWNPLYTAAPKQQAMEVTEEMVRRALHFCPSELSSPQKRHWITKFITTELLAALAQQGREAGEAWKVRVFPVAVNGEDDAHCVEMKRGVQSFRVGPDYWDTREEAEAYAGQLRIALAAPKQQAMEVTEEMVDRACEAFYRDTSWRVNANGSHDAIRAALLAALPGKMEVDRG